MVTYKQKCGLCRQKWGLVTSSRQKFVLCVDCEMKEVVKDIEDKKYKKLFDLPIDLYKENSFLRSVRYQYGRWGSITEKQEEAFKKAKKELKLTKKKKPVKDKKTYKAKAKVKKA